jgi:hypothetical protein
MSRLYHNSSVFRSPVGYQGKVGGFFTFPGEAGCIFGISNNHVIADINRCSEDDPIAVPGGGIVGSLYAWIRLDLHADNTLDLAFFKLSAGVAPIWNMPGGLTRPTDFIEAARRKGLYVHNEFRASFGYDQRSGIQVPELQMQRNGYQL